MKIACEHPTIIVNPNIGELIAKYGCYYFAGRMYHNASGYKPYFNFDKRHFNAYRDHINEDNITENVVIDESTGNTFPIYLCVPCGHCVLCKEKKLNSLVNRIKYESFCYTDKPYFLTLTYNNQWLPSDGVSVRDVQLYFKRLRRNLERNGYVQPLRYIVVGEYGKHTRRPHYHAIIFGLPSSDDTSVRDVQALLDKSWQRGFTLSRTVDMSDEHTAFYTAKYTYKSCDVPDGCNRLFQNSSRRGGGLGSRFFDKQAKSLRCRVTTNPVVLNPFTGKTEPFMWSLYAIDRIFPSEKRFVPLKLRKALKKYSICKTLISQFEPELNWLYETNYQRIKSKFGSLVFVPLDFGSLKHIASSYTPDYSSNIYEVEREILKYIDLDFSKRDEFQRKREFLLSNLSLNQQDVDLVQRIASIKRRNHHLSNIEVL